MIDSDGSWISPNLVLGLVLEHLVKNRGMKGKIVRSVMTSHFVDAVAKSHGLEVRQTQVGFKHVGTLAGVTGKASKAFLRLDRLPEHLGAQLGDLVDQFGAV